MATLCSALHDRGYTRNGCDRVLQLFTHVLFKRKPLPPPANPEKQQFDTVLCSLPCVRHYQGVILNGKLENPELVSGVRIHTLEVRRSRPSVQAPLPTTGSALAGLLAAEERQRERSLFLQFLALQAGEGSKPVQRLSDVTHEIEFSYAYRNYHQVVLKGYFSFRLSNWVPDKLATECVEFMAAMIWQERSHLEIRDDGQMALIQSPALLTSPNPKQMAATQSYWITVLFRAYRFAALEDEKQHKPNDAKFVSGKRILDGLDK